MTNEPTTLATSVPQGKPDPASSIAAAETSARATPPIAVPRATARYSKNPSRNAPHRGPTLPAPVTHRFLPPLHNPPPSPTPPPPHQPHPPARQPPPPPP